MGSCLAVLGEPIYWKVDMKSAHGLLAASITLVAVPFIFSPTTNPDGPTAELVLALSVIPGSVLLAATAAALEWENVRKHRQNRDSEKNI